MGGLTDRAGDLFAVLSAELSAAPGELPAPGSAAAKAFDGLPTADRLTKVRGLLGDAAYEAALADHVRSLPGQAGLSDAAALKAVAGLSPERQAAAVGSLLAGAYARLAPAARQGFSTRLAQSTAPGRQALGDLADWLTGQTGQAVAPAQALAVFEDLPLARQVVWVHQVLADEVRAAGRVAASASGADKQAAYDRALRAIETVFPSEGRADGELRLTAAQRDLGLAERLAVGLGGAGAVRRALADARLAAHQHRLVGRLGLRDGTIQRREVVSVDIAQHRPAIGFEAARRVVGEPPLHVAVDRNAVVVVEGDQLVQLPGAGQRAGLVADAFHQATVAEEDIGSVIDHRMAGAVELVGQQLLGQRHADGIADPLAERAGGGLDAGRDVDLGVAGRA